MATDTERLVLELSAQLQGFEKAMLTAAGQADRAAIRIEQRFKKMNETAARSFQDFQHQVTGIISAIALTEIVRQVGELGDLWRRVGNQLAFSGISARDLAAEQQVVADIAVRTRSDLEVTAQIFGRILESSERLGVSQAQVGDITETLQKALREVDQTQRGGIAEAISLGLNNGQIQVRQIRTLLTNSVPLAQALANEMGIGLNHLSEVAKRGEISAHLFVRALLDAGPAIDERFQRTSRTIDDSFHNLATRAAQFVGTNNQTSHATGAFADTINAVAGNFETLADAAIVAAAVIGGTFAGIAVAKAGAALLGMAADLLTVAGRAEAAEAILEFFGGGIGIALAVAGAGMAYLATQTNAFASASESSQRAHAGLIGALQAIADATPATVAQTTATTELRNATAGVSSPARDAATAIAAMGHVAGQAVSATSLQADAASALAVATREQTLATIDQVTADYQAVISAQTRDRALRGLASFLNSNPGFGGNPARERANQERIDQQNADADAAIADAHQQIALLNRGRTAIASGALVVHPAPTPQGGSPDQGPPNPNALSELRLSAEISLARAQHETVREHALSDILEIEKQTDALVHDGVGSTAARAEAERNVTALRAASNAEAARSVELADLQDQADIARANGLQHVADALTDELAIRTRIRRLTDEGVSADEARKRAEAYVHAMREAAEQTSKVEGFTRTLNNELAIAQARGDAAHITSLQREIDLENRIAELRQQGHDPQEAVGIASKEVAALEEADLQGKFRQWFTGGVTASINGDLSDFFENWLRERATAALTDALNNVADTLFEAFRPAFEGLLQGGAKNITDAIQGSLSQAGSDGLSKLADDAAAAGTALTNGLGAAASSTAANVALQGTQALATATKDAAISAQKGAATLSLIAADTILAKSALAAAAALQAVAAGGGGKGGFDLLSSVVSLFGGGGGFGASSIPTFDTGSIGFPGFAGGGNVKAGVPIKVGELGPELFVPSTPGRIVPNNQLGGGFQYVDARTITFQGTGAEINEFRALMAEDLRTRRQQFQGFVNDGFDRREILRR